MDVAFDLPAVGGGEAIGDLHLHHGPQVVNFEEDGFFVGEEQGGFYLQSVIALLVGIVHRPMPRAVVGGPAIVPLEDAPVVGIGGGFCIEGAGEADLQAVGVDV